MIEFFKRQMKEFREFAMRGNVVDMAIGIIIGAAFGKIVDSMVKDIVMPPLGWLLGKVDFTNLYFTISNPTGETFPSLEAAQAAGAVTINYGLFINTLISFLMVAFSIFLIIKCINKVHSNAKKEEEAAPTTKTCPKCFSEVDIRASKCPHCTADI